MALPGVGSAKSMPVWRSPATDDLDPMIIPGSPAENEPDPADDLLGPGLVTGHVLGLFAALGRGDRFDPRVWEDGTWPGDAEGSGSVLSGDGVGMGQSHPIPPAAESRTRGQLEEEFLQWSDLHPSFSASFVGSDFTQQQREVAVRLPPDSSGSSGEGQESDPAAVTPGRQPGEATGPDSSRLEQPEAEYIGRDGAHSAPGQTGTEI